MSDTYHKTEELRFKLNCDYFASLYEGFHEVDFLTECDIDRNEEDNPAVPFKIHTLVKGELLHTRTFPPTMTEEAACNLISQEYLAKQNEAVQT